MFTAYKTSDVIYLRDKAGWYVVTTPTGNCQIFSIISAYQLFYAYADKTKTRKEFKNASQKAGGKRLCYIDVTETYAKKVESFFDGDGEIVMKNPFKSTNGSKMVFFLLNLSNL